MRIINTAEVNLTKLDTLGKLALYSGMDNLTLYEINDGLDELLTPEKRTTYNFEMGLQAPLLEMSLNGIPVDQPKRDELILEHEQELQKVHILLHQLCEATGYYRYYLDQACLLFAAASGYAIEMLPRSWAEWLALDIQERKAIKRGNEEALALYHKALRTFGPPYCPGDRNAWRKHKNGAFNGNSTTHKLRLLYDFFGSPDNENADKIFHPPWNKARGIKEIRTRNSKGDFTPSADRESLEKIRLRGLDLDERDAYYWALPFATCCLEIADYAKALGFLRCRLERGIFRASFGAITASGRLNSKENAQGYGSNAQNISPRLRVILTSKRGWKFGTPDYEQIESRIVGAICYRLFGATAYLNATESGDLHSLACSMVWDDLPWPKDFTLSWLEKHGPFPSDMIRAAKKIAGIKFYRGKSRRDVSKTLGHGSNYLGKPQHMAKQSHIPLDLVEHYQDVYFSAFPEIKQWHQWVVTQIQTKGELTTMLGRVRQFFGRPTDDGTIRKAVAHEPQSVGADYTNRALLRLLKAYLYDNLPIKLFLQKHDEIGFTYLEGDEDLVMSQVCKIMEERISITDPNGRERKWSVPVEALCGWNLGHASASNPDGLITYLGHDSRTRQRDPFNLLKRRLR